MLKGSDERSSGDAEIGPGSGGVIGCNNQLNVVFLHFFHAAIESNTTILDKDQITEDMFDLLDLMGGDDDGAFFIKVVV